MLQNELRIARAPFQKSVSFKSMHRWNVVDNHYVCFLLRHPLHYVTVRYASACSDVQTSAVLQNSNPGAKLANG